VRAADEEAMFRSSPRTALLLTLGLVAVPWAAASASDDSGQGGTSTTKTETTKTEPPKTVTTPVPSDAADPPSEDTGAPTPAEEPGPTSDGPTQHEPASEPEHSKPELGHSVGVDDHDGTVRVQTPGSDSWQAAAALDTLPVGSVVDATQGHVTLRTAVDPDGTTQTGTFWGAKFQVRQAPGGVTELVLSGPRPHCARAGSALAAASTSHGLWGHDNHGKFRTRGRNSVATVRGTTWFVAERCGGTYTRVTSGSVRVWDTHTRRSVVVHAGESYLARNRD
jgi:hypothetical protein